MMTIIEITRARRLPSYPRDDFQDAVRQRSLELECFFRRRRQLCLDVFWRCQDDGHGFGVNGANDVVRFSGQEGEQIVRRLSFLDLRTEVRLVHTPAKTVRGRLSSKANQTSPPLAFVKFAEGG
jgi:hypothetical protein